MTIKEEFARLALDLKEHMAQEYASGEWIGSDADTFHFFKQLALQNKHPQQQIKAPPHHSPPVKNVVHAVIKAPPTISEKTPEPIKVESVPDIKKEVKVEEKQATLKKGFQPTPMTPIAPHDLSDIRKIVHENYPHFTIIDKVPSGTPEVLLIVQEDSPFMSHLARAIDILLAPAAILRNVPPYTAKLVISTRPLEIPHLLVDPTLYLKDPLQKVYLWKKIKDNLITNQGV